MTTRRSRFTAFLAAALFVAACGDDGGAVVTPTTPTTTTVASTTTSSAVATTTTVVDTTTRGPRVYPQDALDYFVEVAFGPEFGGGSPEIRKWTQDVRISVNGDPDAADLEALDAVIADLNALIGPIRIEIVEVYANVDLWFAPEAEFSEIEPNYVPVNMGFFWVYWSPEGAITSSRVLISTTGLTQAERNHIIREEVTQSLGLMNDSYSYEDSTFYQGWTETQAYSVIDEFVIEMLYLAEILPGMDVDEALAVLTGG